MILSPFAQRTISALVLGPLLLWSIFYLQGDEFFVLLMLLLVPAAWEWGRLSGQTLILPRIVYTTILIVLFYFGSFIPLGVLLSIALIWWVSALFWLRYFPERTKWVFSRNMGHVAGIIVLIPAWHALGEIHQYGVEFLLSLLLLVWSADTGAYLVGRKFGNRKLAPNVSPKKSVEGLLGGVGFALITAIIAYSYLVKIDMGLPLFLLIAVGVVIFSVVGDLVESAYKRNAGIKDSGSLIPGHGGMLDRVDSLTAAAPIFLFLLTVVGGL
ncbi:MAG: phosphatidate cytidylyltransferase [Gammaproteobacteria bacterium]|uniref:Phosphatidate cytidylyltransferase n=1 Tax=Candidatus Thiopontia autotrophica TaxID=2841688 RepID=A0A8J6P8T6_9GAMM|nr:phosphatidate cytidylyltransferase [Candidatus Thiopontia autotrophica]MBL6969660.1 phosphatidate cytidylyltransferase [Gammaproteobacteria bacterium]